LAIGCQQNGLGQGKPLIASILPSVTAAAKEAPAEAKPDEQLEINRNALLNDPSEEIRIKAATVMLFYENPLARTILFDALKQTENNAARKAVCRALVQAQSGQELKNKADFVAPLLGVLAADDPTTAKLAAEATLIFEYEQITGQLEKLISDSSLPLGARLNAIHALELHPDMRAAIRLIRLVDSPESQLAAAAESALHALGIEVGDDAEARTKIIDELVTLGPEAYLRKRVNRQEAQIRNMEIDLKLWQGRYLSALGKVYGAISDDAAKAKFLAEHLSASDAIVKLWALEKVRQDRVGTRPNPMLPAEVGPILVKLVSDQNRIVRLKTAGVLSYMTEVNSAPRLLAQLEAEQDDQVKTELFIALGYAFVPNPKVDIPEEIRKQTLEWAEKFLFEQEPAKAQKGAAVMKKLLEQDGLTAVETNRYLGLLAQRYSEPNDSTNGALRGELLGAMAGLCAPQSIHKDQSQKRFGPLFEAALTDTTDFVREAAVDGLIYTDKAAALKRLRKDFIDDPSAIIRKKLIALAAEVGGKEDLTWLAAKMGSNSESELAWQAMLKIFNGSDAATLNDWIPTFTDENADSNVSDGQKITFLELAERKAVAENRPIMLKNVREKLSELYMKTGQFERAAGYFGRLYEAAATSEEKKVILPDLLSAYLRWPKVEMAAELIENCLLEEDLDPNSTVIRSIEGYLSTPPSGADPNAVLEALTAIKPSQARPMWREWLKIRTARFIKAEDPNKPEEGN